MNIGNIIKWTLIAFAAYMVVTFLGANQNQQFETLSYSELMTAIEQQPATITKIAITNGSNELTVERKDHKPAHVTLPAPAGQQQVLEAAQRAHVNVVAGENNPGLLGTILAILFSPITLMLLVGWWLMRNMGGMGGGSSNMLSKLGNSKIKIVEPGTADSKTFNDVAGCKEAKEELAEIVEFLRDPSSFREMGAKLPKGVLLVGPPGTGKTLLAKAVAGEAGVPFFHMSGSDFVEIFVGKGAATVRDLFDQARGRQPCIVFIDELDAVGKARGAGGMGGNDEREQTLNQMLVEMDGFKENESIVLMAATNRAELLDQAITRAGRFDLHVNVDNPDLEGREAIFRIHMRGLKVASNVDAAHLARLCPGFSGADIASACNQAALIARRRYGGKGKAAAGVIRRWVGKKDVEADKRVITMRDFSEGIDRAMVGPARDHAMSEDQRKNTAVHEAGHAGVGHVLKGAPIRKITIVARAKALGFTLSYPEGDQYNKTRDEMLSEIASMMGGRVAQEEILGVTDTGASNDFEQATKVARAMVTMFGMSPLGHVHISDQSTMGALGRAGGGYGGGGAWGPAVMDQVDVEVRKILDEATERARKVLKEHRASFDRVVECLLTKETILGDEFLKLWNEAAHVCDCDEEHDEDEQGEQDVAAHESAAIGAPPAETPAASGEGAAATTGGAASETAAASAPASEATAGNGSEQPAVGAPTSDKDGGPKQG